MEEANKARRAYDLRQEGGTYRELAAEMGVSLAMAHAYVQQALERLATPVQTERPIEAARAMAAEAVRTMAAGGLSVEAYDAILEALNPGMVKGNPASANATMRALKERAELMKSLEPVEEDEPDVFQTVLSTEELAGIAAILDRAGVFDVACPQCGARVSPATGGAELELWQPDSGGQVLPGADSGGEVGGEGPITVGEEELERLLSVAELSGENADWDAYDAAEERWGTEQAKRQFVVERGGGA